MERSWKVALVHQGRMWSARLAWVAGLVALLAWFRASFIGFEGIENHCGEIPFYGIVTMWGTDDDCLRQGLGWLTVGRVAIVVTAAAVVCWRICYRRDSTPDE